MKKVRVFYLDIIRIFACFMVIAQHSPMPNLDTDSMILSACSFLNYPAIGLFFMVSGALLLPVKEHDSLSFYRHRMKKIIIPTIVWMSFYIILKHFMNGGDSRILIQDLLVMPFSSQGVPAFWFIYVLAGLYLFAPIISPWLEKATKKEIVLFLALWGITLFFPVIKGIVDIPYGYYSILCYFGGYLGYFVVGYYLQKYPLQIKKTFSFLLILVPIVAYVICKSFHLKSDFNTYYYLSIFSATMSIGWFTLIQQIRWDLDANTKKGRFITKLSNSCFGIYLVHLFIMRSVLWECPFIYSHGGLWQIASTTILTLILSYLAITLISKLPFSKYLIGY